MIFCFKNLWLGIFLVFGGVGFSFAIAQDMGGVYSHENTIYVDHANDDLTTFSFFRKNHEMYVSFHNGFSSKKMEGKLASDPEWKKFFTFIDEKGKVLTQDQVQTILTEKDDLHFLFHYFPSQKKEFILTYATQIDYDYGYSYEEQPRPGVKTEKEVILILEK